MDKAPPQLTGGQAVIEDGQIVIRVAIDALQTVVDGAWAMRSIDARQKVTDADLFAKELCIALNREDEQGTTRVHKAFDDAILFAIEQGFEGIEDHEDQDD